jgi:putative ABC transport system permease protein
MQDLRFALRTLRKQPVFTLVAVLTLALGIGANAAIFSLLYQVLLRPLPYRATHRLVFVWNAYLKAGHEMSYVAIPDYLDRRADAPALEDAALLTNRDASLSISGRPEQVTALAVTPSFFSTLGRGPFLGRAFVEADATPGADRFTILTYPTWTSRFGADRDIIGRTIHLNAGEYIVVGVLPADFEVPWPAWRDTALLVPFSFTPAQRSDEERGGEFSMMIGRLREGATIDQLDAQMQTIVNRLMDRVPARAAYMRNSGFTGLATGFREELVRDVRLSLCICCRPA